MNKKQSFKASNFLLEKSFEFGKYNSKMKPNEELQYKRTGLCWVEIF